MLYSYKWLQELSQTKKSAQEIAQLLLTHSFEVEDVKPQSDGLEDVFVGHVIAVQEHPQADKLKIATVDLGQEKLQIVCGAPNLSQGQKVPVAIVGANLPGDFEIKMATIRGVQSAGMICAPDELGLGDDHDGIMVLDHDATIGTSFAKHMELDDTILDIDVLPNRAHDALSHQGMAREIAMLEGRKVLFEEKNLSQIPNGIEVEIQTPNCLRYVGLSLNNITIEPSPKWLQNRLKSLGHNAINNVVDITNYIMLETGQPLHAFSQEYASQINVRQAKTSEKMTLLDQTEVTLSNEDIVITDGNLPIALAGIMGGKGSAITDTTSSVMLEIANFDARSVRATKSRYGLQSDAAYRFERDLDPNLVDQSLARAVELFEQICGAKISAITDVYPEPIKQWSIALPHGEIEKLLGIEIEHSNVQKILHDIEITISQKNDVYLCHVPTVRKDLNTPEDLIEEIGRIYGYDKIHPRPLNEIVKAPAKNEQRLFERTTKDFLITQGFSEVRSYSFYSQDDAIAVGSTEAHVSLSNPMSSQQKYMRRTLAVGLLQSASQNQSYKNTTQLFEIGRLYIPNKTGLPDEKIVLGISVTAKSDNAQQFYVLKGLIDKYFNSLGIKDHYYSEKATRNTTSVVDLHPSRQASIHLQSGSVVGSIGEITKNTAKYFTVKNASTAFCELDLDLIRHISQDLHEFIPLEKYPAVQRDLSIIVAERTRVADMERIIASAGTEILQKIDLFDLYIDKEKAERSMAFHLSFSSPQRTLTAKEVDAIMEDITSTLENEDDIQIKR